MNKAFYVGKEILILGASGGLGRELARQLAERGAARLWLAGRSEERLWETARLAGARGAAAEILPFDVTDDAARKEALVRAAGADGVFIACGIAPGQSEDGWEEAADMRRCFAANVLAPAACLTELARLWRGSHFAAVVTSQAGLFPVPFIPAYGASKAAMNAYGEAVRAHLAAEGVALTLVMPGFFDSPMGRRFAGRKWFVLSAEEAARRTLDGVAKGKKRCIFPWELRWAMALANALPRCIVRAFLPFFAFTTLPDGEEGKG